MKLTDVITEIMAFASKLDKSEKGAGEFGIVHVLLAGSSFRANSESFRFGVTLESVQIQYTIRATRIN